LDCQKIHSEKILRVIIYYTPNGYCWFPTKKEVKENNIFVGTPLEIAKRIKELNRSLEK